jgi:hypothetical protein
MTSTLSAANEPTIINYAQQTAISSGSILEVHPLYRDRGLLSFPCFRTDAVFNHGMSGGPIFDEAGNVIGVVCSGETDSSYSYGSLIWPIFGAQIDFLKEPGEAGKTIYDLAVSGKIQTDESLKSINVTTNPDGSRTINYLAPSGA